MIYLHPRREAALRQAPLPVAGVPNFRCKACGNAVYQFKGRKRVYQGWICAGCQQ